MPSLTKCMTMLIGLLVLAIPNAAYANIGLPMLSVAWPLSLPSIIPVVLIETWVVCRSLKVAWPYAFGHMIRANALSTIVGVPIAWAMSLGMQLALMFAATEAVGLKLYPPTSAGEVVAVLLTAPWLEPLQSRWVWAVPVAMMVLLIPFFLVSFALEAWYLSKSLCPEDSARSRGAILKANAASYLFLFLACLVWLVISIV